MCNICSIKEKYKDLFTERIGKINTTQIKLFIDDSVKPVQQKHRRIPFHLRSKVEVEINQMLKDDIIKKVTEPT